MTARSMWGEESPLADMKNRLDKLRVDQSKQKVEDGEFKKDTLKILQARFGSPVYDPTSPAQKAYARKYARSGRRKSIEFEDLYITKGSGRLHRPVSPGNGFSQTEGATSSPKAKHPLVRSSSQLDSPGRVRKISDPSFPHSRRDQQTGSGGRAGLARQNSGGKDHQKGGKGQGQPEGQKGQAQRGLLSVAVSEEDRKLIDKKLARIDSCQDKVGGSSHHQPRTRKTSTPAKPGSKH